jgi:large subunit ribosomal protein L23
MNADKVLKHVRLTEKATKLSADLGQYTFEVYPTATKHTVAGCSRADLQGHRRRVNIQNYRGKNKKSRTGRPTVGSDYKKAIVTLKAGDKIELV